MAKTDEVMPWNSNAILKDIFPQADGVLINDLLHHSQDLTQVTSWLADITKSPSNLREDKLDEMPTFDSF